MTEEANVFIPDEDGINELARSDEMTAALFIEGQHIADQIIELTPVNSDVISPESNAAQPGEIRDSIMVIPNEDGEGPYDFGVRVAAMDWRFHWIEFGTGGRHADSGAFRGVMPAFGPFRRVAETADQFVPAGSGSQTSSEPYTPGSEHGR